jgi:hypothetical protein
MIGKEWKQIAFYNILQLMNKRSCTKSIKTRLHRIHVVFNVKVNVLSYTEKCLNVTFIEIRGGSFKSHE